MLKIEKMIVALYQKDHILCWFFKQHNGSDLTLIHSNGSANTCRTLVIDHKKEEHLALCLQPAANTLDLSHVKNVPKSKQLLIKIRKQKLSKEWQVSTSQRADDPFAFALKTATGWHWFSHLAYSTQHCSNFPLQWFSFYVFTSFYFSASAQSFLCIFSQLVPGCGTALAIKFSSFRNVAP